MQDYHPACFEKAAAKLRQRSIQSVITGILQIIGIAAPKTPQRGV